MFDFVSRILFFNKTVNSFYSGGMSYNLTVSGTNPCFIDYEHEKLLILYKGSYNTDMTDCALKASNNNTILWYTESNAPTQLNGTGETYNYVSLG